VIMQIKAALWFLDESFTLFFFFLACIKVRSESKCTDSNLSMCPFDFICFKSSVSNNRKCC